MVDTVDELLKQSELTVIETSWTTVTVVNGKCSDGYTLLFMESVLMDILYAYSSICPGVTSYSARVCHYIRQANLHIIQGQHERSKSTPRNNRSMA